MLFYKQFSVIATFSGFYFYHYFIFHVNLHLFAGEIGIEPILLVSETRVLSRWTILQCYLIMYVLGFRYIYAAIGIIAIVGVGGLSVCYFCIS